MKLLKNLIYVCVFLSFSAKATVVPIKQNGDSRISVVNYSPKNVIRVNVNFGVSTLIQLEKNEKILKTTSNVGIGDELAWSINTIDNNVFLKPIAYDPNTNLTVVTDKNRTYFFDLTLSDNPHYLVKLHYSENITSNNSKIEVPCYDSENINFDYQKWGDESISPNYMWDDGRFTCLKFSYNSEMPLIYKLNPDGSESLVNYSVNKDTIVVHSVSEQFRLRLGTQVLGLISKSISSDGYNNKSSSINAKRVVNHE